MKILAASSLIHELDSVLEIYLDNIEVEVDQDFNVELNEDINYNEDLLDIDTVYHVCENLIADYIINEYGQAGIYSLSGVVTIPYYINENGDVFPTMEDISLDEVECKLLSSTSDTNEDKQRKHCHMEFKDIEFTYFRKDVPFKVSNPIKVQQSKQFKSPGIVPKHSPYDIATQDGDPVLFKIGIMDSIKRYFDKYFEQHNAIKSLRVSQEDSPTLKIDVILDFQYYLYDDGTTAIITKDIDMIAITNIKKVD